MREPKPGTLEGEKQMLGLLVQWLLSAIALLIVSRLVPGFHVD